MINGKDLKEFIKHFGDKSFDSFQSDKKVHFDDLNIMIDVEAGLFSCHYVDVEDICIIVDSENENMLLEDAICLYPDKDTFKHLNYKQYEKLEIDD